jgi:3',5'-cyclic AMP phosphodiesterase CpdA
MNTSATLSRREAVGGLASLLAAGLWPGALRAAGESPKAAYEEFTFVQANDFHHEEPACDPWFEALFKQMGAHPGAELFFLLGDFANKRKRESFEAMRRFAKTLPKPFYTVPGNHDNDLDKTTSVYSEFFPGQLNYTFAHRGWQVVALDSTQGNAGSNTRVQPATLAWLDAELPKLDPKKPTILVTHFPLARETRNAATNADDVLARFLPFNLRVVLGGHYHAKTEVKRGEFAIVTNACCSRVANNHDGTKDKGYWLCRAKADGTVERSFQLFTFAAPATPTTPATRSPTAAKPA